MYPIYYLKYLGLAGAHKKYVLISIKDMADDLIISSKTVARNIKKLDDDGFIEREIVSNGQKVHIKEKGLEILRSEYIDYKEIFEVEDCIEIHGKVISGLGEGMYYINIPGYQEQFKEKLGFTAYPGTLNIKVDKRYMMNRKKMKLVKSIEIEGFHDGERNFGSAKCYPAQIESIKCAIIVPSRTHHDDDLLEIIAPERLRDSLKLKDDDDIAILVNKKNKTD